MMQCKASVPPSLAVYSLCDEEDDGSCSGARALTLEEMAPDLFDGAGTVDGYSANNKSNSIQNNFPEIPDDVNASFENVDEVFELVIDEDIDQPVDPVNPTEFLVVPWDPNAQCSSVAADVGEAGVHNLNTNVIDDDHNHNNRCNSNSGNEITEDNLIDLYSDLDKHIDNLVNDTDSQFGPGTGRLTDNNQHISAEEMEQAFVQLYTRDSGSQLDCCVEMCPLAARLGSTYSLQYMSVWSDIIKS